MKNILDKPLPTLTHLRTQCPFNVTVSTRIKTRIMDAETGKCVSERPWEKNLVLDQGLNALARSTAQSLTCYPASAATNIQVGSGTNPNSIASGAITFTQTGTTVTASGGFFTAGMVGGIFKYGSGSGGAEYYITAFSSTTQVTVDTSATVAVPEVATVWMVQQTALQTFLFQSSTYQTNSGDCQTTQISNSQTHKRTYIIAQQAAPYNVNEIGWSSTSTTTRCLGRLVLSSTDVVGTSNFYVVVLELTFTYLPSAPSAVGNVGTNIDTTGTLMFEDWTFLGTVASNGAATIAAKNASLDGSKSVQAFYFPTATYTQNATIGAATLTWSSVVQPGSNQSWALASPAVRGKMTLSFSTSMTTAGQTLHGIGIGQNSLNNVGLDVKFTTPVTAPTGTFQPVTVWSCTYGRTLTN